MLLSPYDRGGFRIYDISDKSKPQHIARRKTGGIGVHRFYMDANYAYISTEMAGYVGAIPSRAGEGGTGGLGEDQLGRRQSAVAPERAPRRIRRIIAPRLLARNSFCAASRVPGHPRTRRRRTSGNTCFALRASSSWLALAKGWGTNAKG